MNDNKAISVLRKRNTLLQEELEKLKKLTDVEQPKEIKDLITELEGIKNEWIEVLEEIYEQRNQYAQLIQELTVIKEAFKHTKE